MLMAELHGLRFLEFSTLKTVLIEKYPEFFSAISECNTHCLHIYVSKPCKFVSIFGKGLMALHWEHRGFPALPVTDTWARPHTGPTSLCLVAREISRTTSAGALL